MLAGKRKSQETQKDRNTDELEESTCFSDSLRAVSTSLLSSIRFLSFHLFMLHLPDLQFVCLDLSYGAVSLDTCIIILTILSLI